HRLIGRWYRRCRRRHMVEESTPFVVVEHEDRVRPRRAARYRGVYLVDERLTIPDVGEWMIVIRGSDLFAEEPWFHERHGGKCSRGGVEKKGLERPADRHVLRSP